MSAKRVARSLVSLIAAHAGGDKYHVSAGQVVADLVEHLFGSGAADVGLRTRAETPRGRHTHLDDALRPRGGQGLGICVGYDEIDAMESSINHVVDGVTARATDTENVDPRPQFADGLPLLGARGARAGSSFMQTCSP
jgi:hypothetical protein